MHALGSLQDAECHGVVQRCRGGGRAESTDVEVRTSGEGASERAQVKHHRREEIRALKQLPPLCRRLLLPEDRRTTKEEEHRLML